jgi:hypothetical protein
MNSKLRKYIALILSFVIFFPMNFGLVYADWLNDEDKVVLICKGQQTGWIHRNVLSEDFLRIQGIDRQGVIEKAYEDIEFKVKIDLDLEELEVHPFNPGGPIYDHASIFEFVDPIKDSINYENQIRTKRSTAYLPYSYIGYIDRYTGKIDISLSTYTNVGDSGYKGCRKQSDYGCLDRNAADHFYNLRAACVKVERLF